MAHRGRRGARRAALAPVVSQSWTVEVADLQAGGDGARGQLTVGEDGGYTPDKIKIVYCRDKTRRQEFECTSFTFLGYAFRPRKAKSGKTGSYFASFQPAI